MDEEIGTVLLENRIFSSDINTFWLFGPLKQYYSLIDERCESFRPSPNGCFFFLFSDVEYHLTVFEKQKHQPKEKIKTGAGPMNEAVGSRTCSERNIRICS